MKKYQPPNQPEVNPNIADKKTEVQDCALESFSEGKTSPIKHKKWQSN